MNLMNKLSCLNCGREFDWSVMHYTCPDCGPVQGTLEVGYDLAAAGRVLNREALANDRRVGQARYAALLPVDNDKFPSPLAVGGTPVYSADSLAKELGLAELLIKDDGRNPSASYKDRASAVGLAKALEYGAGAVAAASSGNAAASWSAFAAAAGLPCYIFVPQTIPQPKLAQLSLFGAKVIKVLGSYDQAFDLADRAATELGWYNRSTAINPYLGEGKKTGAFELSEQTDFDPPDYLAVGAGDGCIIQGLAKGFREFRELGLINKSPKLIGVQAEGAAPLVRAFEAKAELCDQLEAETLADSISVGFPRDQFKALRAVRDCGGRFVSVPDEAILRAMSDLAQSVGVAAEPAGAVGLAGLRKLAREGLFRPGDRAAVLVTGSGLKDVASAVRAARGLVVEAEPDWSAVRLALSRFTSDE